MWSSLISSVVISLPKFKERGHWDFSAGPVARTLCFPCRWHGFNPWSGNWDLTCCTAWPKKRNIDPAAMEEMSRSHCRKINIVVVIIGKYSPHSPSSDHSASHPFHLQNILKPSPKTTMSQPMAQVISVRSRGVWIPQVQQLRLHFSSLNTRKFTLAPTHSINNRLGHNVDTIVQKGRKQESHSNCRSVSCPQ